MNEISQLKAFGIVHLNTSKDLIHEKAWIISKEEAGERCLATPSIKSLPSILGRSWKTLLAS